MSLDVIPAGARVLLDANILIYARRGMSAQSRRLLERCAQHEVTGVLTTIIVAEFRHRRMMQEAQSRGLAASNPAKALAQNPALVRQLTQYGEEVEDLLSGDLLVLGVENKDFAKADELQRTHGLLTNDSLNLAAGLRAAVNMLATADLQFDSIPGITVFKPDDLHEVKGK
jgi:predicted nucleic acid-binding protein